MRIASESVYRSMQSVRRGKKLNTRAFFFMFVPRAEERDDGPLLFNARFALFEIPPVNETNFFSHSVFRELFLL